MQALRPDRGANGNGVRRSGQTVFCIPWANPSARRLTRTLARPSPHARQCGLTFAARGQAGTGAVKRVLGSGSRPCEQGSQPAPGPDRTRPAFAVSKTLRIWASVARDGVHGAGIALRSVAPSSPAPCPAVRRASPGTAPASACARRTGPANPAWAVGRSQAWSRGTFSTGHGAVVHHAKACTDVRSDWTRLPSRPLAPAELACLSESGFGFSVRAPCTGRSRVRTPF
jgi:hypothetical protein